MNGCALKAASRTSSQSRAQPPQTQVEHVADFRGAFTVGAEGDAQRPAGGRLGQAGRVPGAQPQPQAEAREARVDGQGTEGVEDETQPIARLGRPRQLVQGVGRQDDEPVGRQTRGPRQPFQQFARGVQVGSDPAGPIDRQSGGEMNQRVALEPRRVGPRVKLAAGGAHGGQAGAGGVRPVAAEQGPALLRQPSPSASSRAWIRSRTA
ncbi:MAG TPA: hypothetical protein DDY78_22150 [Planctomycetales bacterium]|nr:hypothetical protein [Planctomycetales bacterium]